MAQCLVQSVQKYVDELKKQVSLCIYENFTDIMLRDQLVFGIANESTRKRLLTESTLTLDKAVTVVIAIEQTEKDAYQLTKRNRNLDSVHLIKSQTNDRFRSSFNCSQANTSGLGAWINTTRQLSSI